MDHDYLVTGGAGFIGSNICRALLREGKKVRVLDNLSTGKRDNIADILGSIDFIEGDIRSPRLVRKALKGISYVIHQAAIPSVPRSIADPLTTHKVNTTGTLNLLKEASSAKVKRFVSASSSSVYGDNDTLPKSETLPLRPLSPYALSKVVGEEYCRIFSRLHGITCISLRYFNVFGPFQDPESDYAAVIPSFINAYLRGSSPTIYGDGLQTRDFTYIDNVVAANLAACHRENVETTVVNIGAGKRTNLIDLCRSIKKLTGASVDHQFGPPRAGDVRDSHADISHAKFTLGYVPQVGLEDGLKKTIDWFRNRNSEGNQL